MEWRVWIFRFRSSAPHSKSVNFTNSDHWNHSAAETSTCPPAPAGPARTMRDLVISAPPAGLRFRKSTKAHRSATPAAMRRPLPLSVSSASPAVHWPHTVAGVRHGPDAQHGHRTEPRGTPRCQRVRIRTHFTPQIPKGLMARPLEWSPQIACFVPKHTHRPACHPRGGPGSVWALAQLMWGLGGLEFGPEAALVAKTHVGPGGT